MGAGHRPARRRGQHAAVARRRAARHVRQRAAAVGRAEGPHRTLGRGRCAAGQPGGSAAEADVRRRLEHRHPRSGVRAARGLRGPRAGHDSVRELLRADGIHRDQVAAGDRGPARQSRAGASHPRLLPGPARRHGRRADHGAQPRGQHAAAAADGQPTAAAADRTVASAGHLRARHRSAGVPARHRSAAAAGRRDPVPDALHEQRHRRHRPIESRTHLREAAASHRDARVGVPERQAGASARRRRSGGRRPTPRLRRTRSCGVSSRTRTCAASSGATC